MVRTIHLLLLLVAAGVVNLLLYADVVRHVLPARAPAPAVDAGTHPRMVVIGADGVDFAWLARYLDADAARAPAERVLPNLLYLRETGALRPLLSETPPESPVAWASVMTGVNPGRHRIFDFVLPGEGYRPVGGMVDVTRMRLFAGKVPIRPPQVRPRLAAPTFLERIYEAGYPIVSLRQPLLFPAKNLPGARMLSGLGTPDIAGGAGFYTVWSALPGFPRGNTIFGGVQIPLDPPEDGIYSSRLPGPVDPTLDRHPDGRLARTTLPVTFQVLHGERPIQVAIQLAGRTERVTVGERTPFMLAPFKLGTWPPISVVGHVRFEVKKTDPHLVILADPVNIYAPESAFPLTTPREYAGELFERYGIFETVGWSEQTFALNDGYQDDEGFLRDLLEDMDRGGGLLLGEIDRGGKCVFQVITAIDRGLHCFYRLYDEGHPIYEAGRAEALGDPILQLHARLDKIVGDVLGRLEKDDVLIVCSDHGFQSWRWEVNLNRWLMEEGYMAVRSEVREQHLANLFQDGALSADAVDWSKTRAYAMGLGQIYLNVRGREDDGIVDPEDAPALAREIRERLLKIRNPYEPGDQPIREVYLLKEVYEGPWVGEAAEIQVGFDATYRVSWQTALLGGMGKPVIEANRFPWSGDHCSTDPSVVLGILMANRAVPPAPEGAPYHVRDIAATAVTFFGLDASDMDARPIPLEETGR